MHIDENGMLDIQPNDLIGQSVAILGIKGSGKSNTAAVLMEEMLAAGIPICVVDIAGEYWTLKEMFPKVTVIGRSTETTVDVALTRRNIAEVACTSYTNGASVVLDISGFRAEKSKKTDEESDDWELRENVLLEYFREIRKQALGHRIPCVIFLEEAHNWMPQRGVTAVSGVLTTIAAEDRKRGLSLVMVSQRSARLNKDVLTQADISFLHRVRHPADLKVYIDMVPRPPRRVRDLVNALDIGTALILKKEKVLRYQIRLRKTRDVGFTPTLKHVPSQQLSLLDHLEAKGGKLRSV